MQWRQFPLSAWFRSANSPWPELAFAALLLFGGLRLVDRVGNEAGVIPIEKGDSPSNAQILERKEAIKESLTITQELEKLLLSLGGLLLAGVVTIVAKDGQVRSPPPRLARFLLILAFESGGFSMYFGYLTYIRLLEILEHGYYSSEAPQIWSPLKWQFRLLLLGAIGLVTFTMYSWYKKSATLGRAVCQKGKGE